MLIYARHCLPAQCANQIMQRGHQRYKATSLSYVLLQMCDCSMQWLTTSFCILYLPHKDNIDKSGFYCKSIVYIRPGNWYKWKPSSVPDFMAQKLTLAIEVALSVKRLILYLMTKRTSTKIKQKGAISSYECIKRLAGCKPDYINNTVPWEVWPDDIHYHASRSLAVWVQHYTITLTLVPITLSFAPPGGDWLKMGRTMTHAQVQVPASSH